MRINARRGGCFRSFRAGASIRPLHGKAVEAAVCIPANAAKRPGPLQAVASAGPVVAPARLRAEASRITVS